MNIEINNDNMMELIKELADNEGIEPEKLVNDIISFYFFTKDQLKQVGKKHE